MVARVSFLTVAGLALVGGSFPVASATSYTYFGSGTWDVAQTMDGVTLLATGRSSFEQTRALACPAHAGVICDVPCAGGCTVEVFDHLLGTPTSFDSATQVILCDRDAGHDVRCYSAGTRVHYPSQTGVIDIFVEVGSYGTVTVN